MMFVDVMDSMIWNGVFAGVWCFSAYSVSFAVVL